MAAPGHSSQTSTLFRLSPAGRGREAMTYGCVAHPTRLNNHIGAAVSHPAELVRGKFHRRADHLIRSVSPKASLRLDGPPAPRGEKGRLWQHRLHTQPWWIFTYSKSPALLSMPTLGEAIQVANLPRSQQGCIRLPMKSPSSLEGTHASF